MHSHPPSSHLPFPSISAHSLTSVHFLHGASNRLQVRCEKIPENNPSASTVSPSIFSSSHVSSQCVSVLHWSTSSLADTALVWKKPDSQRRVPRCGRDLCFCLCVCHTVFLWVHLFPPQLFIPKAASSSQSVHVQMSTCTDIYVKKKN